MSHIIVDASISGQLMNLAQPTELRDPSGRLLGQFIPMSDSDLASVVDLSKWEPISPDISPEELERRSKSTEKRYTTAEVLAYLEKL